MILNIRTDKPVVDMDPTPSMATSDGGYRLFVHDGSGNWHVTHSDGTHGHCWGSDLLFLP